MFAIKISGFWEGVRTVTAMEHLAMFSQLG